MFRTSAFRLKSIIDDIDLKGGKRKKQSWFEMKMGETLLVKGSLGVGMRRNDVWAEDPQPQKFHIKNSFQGFIHFSVGLREIASFFWLVLQRDDRRSTSRSIMSFATEPSMGRCRLCAYKVQQFRVEWDEYWHIQLSYSYVDWVKATDQRQINNRWCRII